MKYLLTFAGPIGSSKSPIAHYLSQKLNLPILCNDIVRTEVIEDLGFLDESEFRSRAHLRALDLMKSGKSFIFDASIDRQWPNLKKLVDKYHYQTFVISLDITYPFLKKMHKDKNYAGFASRLRENFDSHQDFKKNYSELISFSITNKNFPKRLHISQKAVKSWLKRNGP